jgi:hypothetical protein
MTTIVIKPKSVEELNFLKKLLQKLNIDVKLINEPIPNEGTITAMQDVANKKGTWVKDTNELFAHLGI